MDYRELLFYQKAQQVVRGVNTEIKRWPRTAQAQTISRQIFKAATSVGANIAEGHGRHFGQEYIHYLFIAQGSANEVDHWLNTALDCQIGDPEALHSLVRLNNETRKMLRSTLTSLHRKQAAKAVKEPTIPYSPVPFSTLEDDD